MATGDDEAIDRMTEKAERWAQERSEALLQEMLDALAPSTGKPPIPAHRLYRGDVIGLLLTRVAVLQAMSEMQQATIEALLDNAGRH